MKNYEWEAKAACRNWGMDLFFAEEGSRDEPWRRQRARAVCETCPVRKECLRMALEMEKRGSIPLGYATYLRSDWVPDHKETCWDNCKDQRHWRKASDAVTFKTDKFSASFTPPTGIYGGLTPQQRHARDIKHEIVVGGMCVRGLKCSGCRPIEEWLDELLGTEAA